jgi:predicted lipoprotein
MKKIIIPVCIFATVLAGCAKNDNNTSTIDFNTAKTNAISDFVNKVALPGYAELQAKANTLNTAIIALNANTTDANLTAAKNAWIDIRLTWERSEGFLFGPVEDGEYDPDTDTWPVNFTDMDALLSSTQPLSTVADIEALGSRSLKGYHPIEYMLWGEIGNKTAAQFTARQKEYLTGLTLHLKSQADALYNSWIPSGGNYAAKFLSAGAGSTTFVKKQDAFIALCQAMVDICGEVGDGKMKEPYDASASNGASLVESPFSGNSTTDFKNNIVGAYNSYLGKFNEDGTGLQDLVKLKNSALNTEIEQKFNTAINSFANITVPYEQAIVNQKAQCLATMAALNDLSSTLDEKLRAFIIQYITD